MPAAHCPLLSFLRFPLADPFAGIGTANANTSLDQRTLIVLLRVLTIAIHVGSARCVNSAPPPPPAIPGATNSSLIPTCAFLFHLPHAPAPHTSIRPDPDPDPDPPSLSHSHSRSPSLSISPHSTFPPLAAMYTHPQLARGPSMYAWAPALASIQARAVAGVQRGALCVHIRAAAGSERGNPAFPFSDSRTPPPPVRAVCIECRVPAGRCVAHKSCVRRASGTRMRDLVPDPVLASRPP
ncbi:hypothetical protein C8F04DRAFT_1271858 [Mycena alexandri]|uniref:Uncharacterized protein n=1 Tax=Mycena alexandri TaxID=1745969 RepID=A0AAD6SB38_9AGAR|nr:hypothetical protein C8F04DRAFT_1271858 [Mycena alexandri]